MNRKELYIPVNVPDRAELIPGFGIKELIACAISLGIGIVIAIIIYTIAQDILWSMGVAIVLLSIAIMIFRKNQYGENLIYKAQYISKYHKSQQKYLYRYHNIYEGGLKK